MGAEGVIQTISGPSARQAYKAAHEQARYEYGRGGYTGTLAESRGHIVHQGRWLLHDAEQVARRLMADNIVRKWEETHLLPLAQPCNERTITVTLDVAGMDYAAREAAADAAVRAKLRAGEGIASLDVQTDDPTTKVSATATKGATERRYVVREVYGDRQEGRRLATLPTQAAARQWATEALSDSPRRFDAAERTLVVTCETVREDGSPLVVVSRRVTRQKATVTATVGTLSQAAPTEWLAVGVYSS